ncbi:MBL fold metallo-hydrolase [Salinisphaera sp.]|uniref:MBL fold metallo-hydrolase n=1 Tax=Salinisphaera sp. TaxID=1914330 RepID=UPI002D787AFB|nr:MBL fold metallo-hydrolase [Salinisphaera sp.]HET7314771.1 MBL fold metallo-hydrolase [Salinisphaera sp.]
MPFNPMHDEHLPVTSLHSGDGHEVLTDVYCLPVQIVNVYFIGTPDRPDNWVLVDAGMPGTESEIMAAAHARFGPSARPRAIVLTHGHFDHVGAVVELARHWDVPVYVHPREMPFVTGQSAYPEPDPSVGGGMVARLSRWFPNKPVDLGDHVRELPEDGSVPELPDWEWIHTPGHTRGHISLFRQVDRAMVVGDAFVTVQQESLYKVFTQQRELSGPPRYFTEDWTAAKASVQRLAERAPSVAMTGHGMAMGGPELREGLRDLIERFDELATPD